MSADQLNRWLTLGANVSVLIGIAFLAYELRQNNLYLAEESRYGQLQNRIEMNRMFLRDPATVRSYYRTDEPTEVARLQRISAGRLVLLQWQWEFQSVWWDTQEDPDRLVGFWRDLYGTTSVREAWEAEGNTFSPSFIQFMETNVVH